MGWALSWKLKVFSLIPDQGTWLGFGPGPWSRAYKRQPIHVSLAHRRVSPSLSSSLLLSLKINKIFFKKEVNLMELLLWVRSHCRFNVVLKKCMFSSGWCSSVDWAQACKPRGCQFYSQPRHMPGLQARSPVGDAWEATTHWCFLFLSFSLHSLLSKNK